jgi:penicillin-binding protein 2
VFAGAPYQAAGKTGTAQVYSLQGSNYKGHALAEHLRDHALFIAFAPAEQPKIALALIVENGGWGAESAGPIARKVLDYYLIDRLKPGAEAAAVAAAASATTDAGLPTIGGTQPPAAIALPASVANSSPAFSPQAASNPAVAKAASAPALPASTPKASAPRAASATPAAPAAALPASTPGRTPAPKKRPTEPTPSMVRGNENDGVRVLAPSGGIDE